MRTMRIVIVIVGILTLLAPMPQAQAQDENAAELIAPQREVSGHWWFDVMATGASSTSRAQETDTRASAEVAMNVHAEEDGGVFNSFLFSSLSADGQARIAAGGQNPGAGVSLSAESRVLQFRFMNQEGTIYELVPIDMWASLDHHAIPDLSSRREFWRRPYSRQVLGGALSFGDFLGNGWDFVRVSMETARFSQIDEMDELRHREHTFDGTFLMYSRARDRSVHGDRPHLYLDIIKFGAKGIVADNGPDAVVGFVDLLRVSGFEILRHRLYVDAAGGFAGTGTMNLSGSSGDDSWSTTINTEDLPNTGSWTGEAHVYGYLNRELSAGLQAEKAVYLTVDVELAIESRISAYTEWRNQYGALAVRAFASRNQLWLDKETSEKTNTGGLFASWHQPVGHGLSIITSVEVARSFYASLEQGSGLRPEAATGANVFVTLAKHFGTDWRQRRLMGL